MKTVNLTPPRSWSRAETHFSTAMDSDWYKALLRLQSTFTAATVQFWSERDVSNGHLPVTTGSVSSPMGLGSDSLPVQVEMFGVPTYLADSMQFSLEYLCRLSDNGAYYVMPSFRGEATDATHLSQFFHSEAEVPGGLDDVIGVVEEYLVHVARQLLDRHADLITAAAGTTDHVAELCARDGAFTRLTFDEAVARLDGPEHVHADELGRWRTLTRAGERALLDQLGPFVWVTHWDHLAVPFYQACDESGTRALNGDLLFGPGEVVGAGERHVTGDEVRSALKLHDVAEDGYEWYVSMKDQAPMRTAGFGLGVERFMMWLLKADDIRDFQLLPRENGRNILP